MPERTVSSLQFERDPSGAMRAADEGPVPITRRGEVSHVLLSIADYRRLSEATVSLVDALGMEGEEIEFEPPRVDIGVRSGRLL